MIKQKKTPKIVQKKLAEENNSRGDTRNGDLLIRAHMEATHIHKKIWCRNVQAVCAASASVSSYVL